MGKIRLQLKQEYNGIIGCDELGVFWGGVEGNV